LGIRLLDRSWAAAEDKGDAVKHRLLAAAAAILVCMICTVGVASAGDFHRAIEAGDQTRVAEMLRADPEVVHQLDTNRTQDQPIHTAASCGQVEIARLLLDAGAVLEAEDADGSTPLHDACLMRQREMVAFLIGRGASVNRRDHNGAYALSFAASGGDTAVVRMVVDAGATLYHRDANGFSLLHYAASRGLGALVDTLLAMGEDVNARTIYGETPLMWAAARNQPVMVETLLAHGAWPNLGNTHGETPLHRAAERGYLDVGRRLLAWGANANGSTGVGWNPTPLHYACWGRQPGQANGEFARLLLAHGADPNFDAGGNLPINMATDNGLMDVIGALLDNGARTDVTEDEFACTPLHIAALRGYRDIAQMLLDHGAAVDAKNARGETPFELAARYGQRDVAELLVERGAAGRAQAPDQGLAAFSDLPEKEAVLWFLGHSGWAIKTANHLLVFDYFEQRPAPAHPGLCNGLINPAELSGEDVMVLVSHEHGDHYDPRIWDWREQLPGVTYVLGFVPPQPPQGRCEVPPHEYLGPRETRTIDGVTITTIESNDSGVGFWVEVDGLTLLHPGDHANRSRDWSTPYKAEIDWLAAKNTRPDIAFFPIAGCGFGDQEAVKMGVHYALETLKPRVFFPMHAGDMTNRYQTFVDECRGRFPKTRMEVAAFKGDRFHYSKGNVAALASRLD
jgi:ankyrin repeat protein/L-ascorbate metabolism protein UlaG (beta-lactamase superfamily)